MRLVTYISYPICSPVCGLSGGEVAACVITCQVRTGSAAENLPTSPGHSSCTRGSYGGNAPSLQRDSRSLRLQVATGLGSVIECQMHQPTLLHTPTAYQDGVEERRRAEACRNGAQHRYVAVSALHDVHAIDVQQDVCLVLLERLVRLQESIQRIYDICSVPSLECHPHTVFPSIGAINDCCYSADKCPSCPSWDVWCISPTSCCP